MKLVLQKNTKIASLKRDGGDGGGSNGSSSNRGNDAVILLEVKREKMYKKKRIDSLGYYSTCDDNKTDCH